LSSAERAMLIELLSKLAGHREAVGDITGS